MDGNPSTRAADRRGFDFTGHMRTLCADMVSRLPELTHIDMDRVAVRFCQTRKGVKHGLQASLTPLRFEGGATTMVRRKRIWTIEPVLDAHGQEMLYLLSFYLPRFLNHPLEEKLATVIHELWHINPAFDGDLRRFEGRCYAHGPAESEYHAAMHELARAWLDRNPPSAIYEFLRYDFRGLVRRHGAVYGVRIRTPRLIPSPTTV